MFNEFNDILFNLLYILSFEIIFTFVFIPFKISSSTFTNEDKLIERIFSHPEKGELILSNFCEFIDDISTSFKFLQFLNK